MTQRILQGAAAVLTYYLEDADGILVDATGVVTVKVTRANGSEVIPAGTPVTHGVVGTYTVGLTPAQTSLLDELTATWTDSAGAVRSTRHSIVGSYVLGFRHIRAFENLADVAKYPNATVIQKRAEVEDEVEEICNRSFVPRFRRVSVDGTGDYELLTAVPDILTVRNVRTYTFAGSSEYSELLPSEIADLYISASGIIRRSDRIPFITGIGNVVIDVECGFSRWGEDLRTAMLIRLRDRLTRADSAIPEQARAYSDQSGFAYDLTAVDEYTTGLRDVDRVYALYSLRKQDDTNRNSFTVTNEVDRHWSFDSSQSNEWLRL